jgi:sugar phosphate isomerase/epimerase
MNLSCLPVSLYPDLTAGTLTLPQWFQIAGDLGLDGADLSVAHIAGASATELDALGCAAADAGVQIVILAAYCDFTHPDARHRLREIDDLRKWIEVAHRLGARFVRVTAGQAHPELEEEETLGRIVEGLTACMDDAAAGGVRLLYENHVRGYLWQHNDFTQSSRRFLEVLRRTRDTSLGVLFDTANNLALDEDPVSLLAHVLPRVGAVHVSDLRQRGTFEPTTIGMGVAPIRQVFQLLTAADYDGWLSIEEASKTGETGFRRAIAFTDQAWIDAGGRARNRATRVAAQRP